MNYVIKAHPTKYNGIMFRSRLEARWAAFFDYHNKLVRCLNRDNVFHWEYEPIDLEGWTPDFYISFPCGNIGCPSRHELYVEVKPANTIEELRIMCSKQLKNICRLSTPSPAMFGNNPFITEWDMFHVSEATPQNIIDWMIVPEFGRESEIEEEIQSWWREAGNEVQWRPFQND